MRSMFIELHKATVSIQTIGIGPQLQAGIGG